MKAICEDCGATVGASHVDQSAHRRSAKHVEAALAARLRDQAAAVEQALYTVVENRPPAPYGDPGCLLVPELLRALPEATEQAVYDGSLSWRDAARQVLVDAFLHRGVFGPHLRFRPQPPLPEGSYRAVDLPPR